MKEKREMMGSVENEEERNDGERWGVWGMKERRERWREMMGTVGNKGEVREMMRSEGNEGEDKNDGEWIE